MKRVNKWKTKWHLRNFTANATFHFMVLFLEISGHCGEPVPLAGVTATTGTASNTARADLQVPFINSWRWHGKVTPRDGSDGLPLAEPRLAENLVFYGNDASDAPESNSQRQDTKPRERAEASVSIVGRDRVVDSHKDTVATSYPLANSGFSPYVPEQTLSDRVLVQTEPSSSAPQLGKDHKVVPKTSEEPILPPHSSKSDNEQGSTREEVVMSATVKSQPTSPLTIVQKYIETGPEKSSRDSSEAPLTLPRSHFYFDVLNLRGTKTSFLPQLTLDKQERLVVGTQTPPPSTLHLFAEYDRADHLDGASGADIISSKEMVSYVPGHLGPDNHLNHHHRIVMPGEKGRREIPSAFEYQSPHSARENTAITDVLGVQAKRSLVLDTHRSSQNANVKQKSPNEGKLEQDGGTNFEKVLESSLTFEPGLTRDTPIENRPIEEEEQQPQAELSIIPVGYESLSLGQTVVPTEGMASSPPFNTIHLDRVKDNETAASFMEANAPSFGFVSGEPMKSSSFNRQLRGSPAIAWQPPEQAYDGISSYSSFGPRPASSGQMGNDNSRANDFDSVIPDNWKIVTDGLENLRDGIESRLIPGVNWTRKMPFRSQRLEGTASTETKPSGGGSDSLGNNGRTIPKSGPIIDGRIFPPEEETHNDVQTLTSVKAPLVSSIETPQPELVHKGLGSTSVVSEDKGSQLLSRWIISSAERDTVTDSTHIADPLRTKSHEPSPKPKSLLQARLSVQEGELLLTDRGSVLQVGPGTKFSLELKVDNQSWVFSVKLNSTQDLSTSGRFGEAEAKEMTPRRVDTKIVHFGDEELGYQANITTSASGKETDLAHLQFEKTRDPFSRLSQTLIGPVETAKGQLEPRGPGKQNILLMKSRRSLISGKEGIEMRKRQWLGSTEYPYAESEEMEKPSHSERFTRNEIESSLNRDELPPHSLPEIELATRNISNAESWPWLLLVLVGNLEIASRRERDLSIYIRLNLAARLSGTPNDFAVNNVVISLPEILVNVSVQAKVFKDTLRTLSESSNFTIMELDGCTFNIARVIKSLDGAGPEPLVAERTAWDSQPAVWSAVGTVAVFSLVAAIMAAVLHCDWTHEAVTPVLIPRDSIRTKQPPPPPVIYSRRLAHDISHFQYFNEVFRESRISKTEKVATLSARLALSESSYKQSTDPV